mgnify:FL=1
MMSVRLSSVTCLSGNFCRHLCALVVGAITLLSIQGCDGPPLQPWHTEQLDAEFTAEKADDIHSFADYRRLEDELFRQLEEEVYAPIPTGSEYVLVRYSAGSAADPQQRQPNWNRTFELQADHPKGAVLLIHGMSDS